MTSFVTFLKNLCHLTQYGLIAELNDCQRQLQEQSNRLLYLELMNMEAGAYSEELQYIRSIGRVEIFPYPLLRHLGKVQCGRDAASGLPYVLHKERKLFFPKEWTEERIVSTYRAFIERENITAMDGDGYLAQTPHQYQSERCHVQDGDVVVDVGAAEGLFSLDVADKASKIYLFENDPAWLVPLKKTFAPYEEKTRIIAKTVSGQDTRHSIRLDTALKGETAMRVFVKMDIEGAEVPVIEASQDFLAMRRNLCLACCTYHRAGDADSLEKAFRNLGYATEFSAGWMLALSRQLSFPYFRKGVIRAWLGETQASRT